jgi:hypothetical protein
MRRKLICHAVSSGLGHACFSSYIAESNKYFITGAHRWPHNHTGNVQNITGLYLQQNALGKTNRLLSFYMPRTTQKTTLPTILCCRENIFTELLPSNERIHRRNTDSFVKTRTAQKMIHPTILLLLRAFVCCGNGFTELLPSNVRRDTIYWAVA